MVYHHRKIALISILIAVLFLAGYAMVKFSTFSNAQSALVFEEPAVNNSENEIILEENLDKEQKTDNKTDSQVINDTVADNNFPSYLEIPSIGVNAYVEHLGLTSEGNMDMTSSTKNVAWYNLGPRPGEIGSAVIGGHYGYPAPAVFRNLQNLTAGDMVYVKGNNGEIKKFVVREIRIYEATDIVSEIFFSDDGKAHLNIVTCNSAWIASLQTYDKRLVVFTDMVI
jgi:LPXTG-site transpeptidase (sortase) family protein